MKNWETLTDSQDLSIAALDYSTTVLLRPAKSLQVTISATVAITETVTITLVSVKGTAYNCVIDSQSLSASKNYFTTDLPYLDIGDILKIQVTNGNTTGIVSVTIVIEKY